MSFKFIFDYDKYAAAYEYVHRSLTTALACLDVKDIKAMKSLDTLGELVDRFKKSEIHTAVINTMEEKENEVEEMSDAKQ